MAIRVKILLFICLLVAIGPLMAIRKDYTKEEDALMVRSVNEIVDAFEKEMKEQYDLRCTGQGGSMPYDIQKIGVRFVRHQQTTIEEARELEIQSTERFVELINTHEEIRPYLRDYPWDHNRTEVVIAFRDNRGKDYPEGITLVLQARDQIIYYGPKKFPNDIDHLKEESYAEAKKIVESSPSSLKPIPKQEKKKRWFDWF